MIIGAAGMVGRKLTARLAADGRLGTRDVERLTLVDVVAPAAPRAELAAFHGVPLDMIDSWIKGGCPAEERGSWGKSYRFNSAAVIAWRIARERSAAVAGIGAGVDTMTREEADRRRAVASMSLAEIEADTAHGGVVLKADVEADIASFCGVLHTGLGSASNRIASRATSMTNAAEIEDLCRAELNRSFESAKVELAEKWAAAA